MKKGKRGDFLSLADAASFYVFVLALLIFVILFKTCGNAAASRNIGEDDSLDLKAQNSQQLLNYLRTPVIQDSDKLAEKYGELDGDANDAVEILSKNPELISDKNYAEFIAQLYYVDKLDDRSKVFKFVTLAMFKEAGHKGHSAIFADFPPEGLGEGDPSIHLWGKDNPGSPEKVALAYIPLYDAKLARVGLYISPEK